MKAAEKTIYEKSFAAESLAIKACVKEFGDEWELRVAIDQMENKRFQVVAQDDPEGLDDDPEDDPEALGDAEDDEPEESGSKMAKALRKYRPGYVRTMSYAANLSADNGDQVAEIIRGLTPDQACFVADWVKEAFTGTHAARYASLNIGQRRMNAGNVIRACVKGGSTTIEALRACVASIKNG